MVQQSLSKAEREARAGDELAARLDALSRPLAERVLGRAIELDHEAAEAAEAAAETIDYETLKEIAFEVGISEEALRRALLEEVDTDLDHDAHPAERATVPDSIRGGLIVAGTGDEIARKLREHLEHEGYRPAPSGGENIWTKTAPPGRRSLAARTVEQSRGHRQFVELDVDTSRVRKTAWRWIIGLVILSLIFNGPIGGLVVLGIFVAGVATVVSWVKRVARAARRTINRTLHALTDDDGKPPDRWLDVWERTRV